MFIYSILITIAFFVLLVLYFINEYLYKTVLKLIVKEKLEDCTFRKDLVNDLALAIDKSPDLSEKSKETFSNIVANTVDYSRSKLENNPILFFNTNNFLKAKLKLFIKGDTNEER